MQDGSALIATGYLSPAYGQSFRPAGEIVTLPDSGLQLIRRDIGSTGACDLLGLYPYSMCRDFTALTGAEDRAALRATGAVALSFVADPFAEDRVRAALGQWPLCRRYKTHFVIDLGGDWRAAPTKNTRYYIRRGQGLLQAETVAPDRSYAALFWRLYRFSVGRHRMRGLQRMSEAIIADQMEAPGAFLTLVRIGDRVVGAMLSYVHDSHAAAHLICFEEDGYRAHAGYELLDAAAANAETLGCRWFNLGGPAGLADDPEDGLYQFKRRWTRTTRTSWLCGQVLDAEAYAALCTDAGIAPDPDGFFPAYRRPGSRFEWQPVL